MSGAVLAAIALGWAALPLFGREAAIISAVVLVSIFGVAFEGRIARTDAVLLLFAVLAQGRSPASMSAQVRCRRCTKQPKLACAV